MAGNVIEHFTPSRAGLIANHTIGIFSPEMCGYELMALGSLAVASVAPGANGVVHHPLVLAYPFTVRQFYWMNGTTVAGNTDMGVYSEDGSALLASTGTVLNAGSNGLQVVSITPVTLPANRRLWLTIGSDNASHQYQRFTITAAADYIGIKGSAAGLSSSLLVVPATFAVGGSTCLRIGMTGSSVL